MVTIFHLNKKQKNIPKVIAVLLRMILSSIVYINLSLSLSHYAYVCLSVCLFSTNKRTACKKPQEKGPALANNLSPSPFLFQDLPLPPMFLFSVLSSLAFIIFLNCSINKCSSLYAYVHARSSLSHLLLHLLCAW